MAERDPLVGFARDLEAEDARLARALAELEELGREADAVGGRARAVADLLERLPDERARAAVEVDAAEEDVAARRADAERAAEELARSEAEGKEERVLAARRASVRTGDALSMAERKLRWSRERAEAVERDAAAAEEEVPALARRAEDLAPRLAAAPRVAAPVSPAPGLAGTIEWASRARAAVFVARGGLETERERVVRQANELAASALGEPLFGASVAVVRARLEAVR